MKSITWKQFAVFILIIIGLILAFSPINQSIRLNKSAEEIAKQIVSKEDHISAEEIGQMIIDGDPNFIIIDVRSNEEYSNFHIKPAYNFPLEILFDPETLANFNKNKLIVLYSNGGTHAAQAWVLLQELGYKNSTVLLGGLNYWVDVYTNPEPPDGNYADHDLFRYQFLKSAGPKLLGNTQSIEATSEAKEPAKLKPRVRTKKKKSGDEGC